MGEEMRQQMRRDMADRLLGDNWRERFDADTLDARPPGGPYCGTDYGYHRHRREGEEACRRCKDAHAAANRNYR